MLNYCGIGKCSIDKLISAVLTAVLTYQSGMSTVARKAVREIHTVDGTTKLTHNLWNNAAQKRTYYLGCQQRGMGLNSENGHSELGFVCLIHLIDLTKFKNKISQRLTTSPSNNLLNTLVLSSKDGKYHDILENIMIF